MQRASFGVLLSILVLLAGCGPEPRAGGRDRPAGTRLDLATSASPGGGVTGTPEQAVVIDGSAVPWAALRPALVEAAGAVVLEEAVLDRVLAREAVRRGLVIDEAEVRAEEDALLDELTTVAPGQARAEVLAEVRRGRGLGPVRFERLLRRNAALRTMVRADAAPAEAELKLARDLAFGEARRVRLFVGGSESEAARAREEAAGRPQSERAWAFSDWCVRASAHPSAARGGLIERFHPGDPAYPDVLGDAVRATPPGGVSPVLATAAGFAVVLVEEVVPAREPTAEEAERVERRVRVRKERLAMERLARELLDRATVSPIDPGLARAWRERP